MILPHFPVRIPGSARRINRNGAVNADAPLTKSRRLVLLARLVTRSAQGRTPLSRVRWSTRTSPCPRLTLPLAGHDARLESDGTRQIFNVEDLHFLPLAGLPDAADRPNGRTSRLDGPLVSGR